MTWAGPSLVRHLWSLAIEIQFYVLCPFLVAALLRRRRRVGRGLLVAGHRARRPSPWRVLAGGADASRAYFGTDTRIGALLTGVLLAFLLVADAGADATGPPSSPRRIGLAGGAVLARPRARSSTSRAASSTRPGSCVCRLATVGLIVAAGAPSRVAGGAEPPARCAGSGSAPTASTCGTGPSPR